MFNRFIINETKSVPYEKTVIEKRSPTDDSVRLYEEIKEKAFRSIVGTIVCNDNKFNFKAILTRDCNSFDKVCRYSFTLNGKLFEGEIPISKFDMVTMSSQDFVSMLVEKLSQKVARELVVPALKGIEVKNIQPNRATPKE